MNQNERKNERKNEITTQIEELIVKIQDEVKIDNQDFEIKDYLTSNEIGFRISHKTQNWNDFVTVNVYSDGRAVFSHGSGAWNSGFTQEEILETVIECFKIAKSIMNKKVVLSKLIIEVSKLQRELTDIFNREREENKEIAYKKCIEELSSKYTKISPEEAIELLKNQAYIELIKVGQYNENDNIMNTEEFEVANFGFDNGSKMNLYLTNSRRDTTHRNGYYQNSISKKDLEYHMTDTYLLNQEDQD